VNLSVELIEVNGWLSSGRWHFDHSARRDESYLTVLHFTAPAEDFEVEGWLPMKANVKVRQVQENPTGLLVEWEDGDRSEVRYANIESVYWDHVSGNGHAESEMVEIRAQLAALSSGT
jgi:hypothetical protein